MITVHAWHYACIMYTNRRLQYACYGEVTPPMNAKMANVNLDISPSENLISHYAHTNFLVKTMEIKNMPNNSNNKFYFLVLKSLM